MRNGSLLRAAPELMKAQISPALSYSSREEGQLSEYFFLFFHENIIMLWVLIRQPHQGASNESYFHKEIRKTSIPNIRKCTISGAMLAYTIQLTLAISTSLISNNRLS